MLCVGAFMLYVYLVLEFYLQLLHFKEVNVDKFA